MLKLLVISDDFTGALDTGVQFAGKGLATKVLSQIPEDSHKWSGMLEEFRFRTQVLVIDAQTRHLNGEEAYEKVWRLVRAAKKAEISYVYKKTDSGLRGNIGKELEAALAASEETYLTFIPAFPDMNRITVGGVHYNEGVPINESAFGRDPFEPVLSARVEDLFSQVPVRTALYRENSHYERGRGREIGIFDASSQVQIKRITEDLMNQGTLGVMAGCAGFASVVGDFLKAEAWSDEGLKTEIAEPGNGKAETSPMTKRLMIICGSINEITRRQIEYAQENGMKRITMTPYQQFTQGYLWSDEGRNWLEGLKKDCETGMTCIVETGISRMKEMAEYRKENQISLEQARITISRTLGQVLKELVEMGLEATFMIIGGDTLAGFMTEAGCGEITVYRELSQGTVLSSVKMEGREQWLISKSGGFGNPRLLMDVEQLVKRNISTTV